MDWYLTQKVVRIVDKELFRQPDNSFRPVPFWSWNHRLRPERLEQQIEQMWAAGMGGFFMHARVGLPVDYLQPEWFRFVRGCVEKAKEKGMDAWLYDEYGWPSGFAAGEVPRRKADYRAKALVLETAERPDDHEYKRLGSYPVDGRSEIVHIYEWLQPLGQERFEDASYVDLLHPEVTRTFLDVTHQRYKQEIGTSFGTAVPGIFSDEACAVLWLDRARPALPWSFRFPEMFLEQYGYDLLPLLPGLFYNVGDYKRIRYDYWKLVVHAMVSHFSEVIYNWCDSMGLRYTGHVMAEDNLRHTMEWIGDVMPHYEYMHIPGIDYLGRDVDLRTPQLSESGAMTTVLTAKQLTSVTHQLGKDRALSELYAGAGHGFDLNMQKWMCDWHFIHGINFFCPHLVPYTLAVGGKRDYPPAIGPQQPYWPDYRVLTDYQARLSYALTCGQRLTDVLVIHPIESAWEQYSPLLHVDVDEMSDKLQSLCLRLLESRIDFDFGSEHFMDKYGRVADDGRLVIGRSGYRHVIISSCSRLRSSTVALLRRFSDEGGSIYAENAGQLLHEVPFLHEVDIQRLDHAAWARMESPLFRIHNDDTGRIWSHARRDGTQLILFLANLSLADCIDTQIDVNISGVPYCWNAETGEVEKVPYTQTQNGIRVEHRFHPAASFLLITEESEEMNHDTKEKAVSEEMVGLSKKFRIVRMDPNTLVLDRFQVWSETDRLTERLPLISLREQWGRWSDRGPTLRTLIISEEKRMTGLSVIAEKPLAPSVWWNGSELEAGEEGWMNDDEFLSFPVPEDLVQKGDNLLELAYANASMLPEPAYVSGPFMTNAAHGPDQSPVLRQILPELGSGNWTTQGFPFFAGKVTVETEFVMGAEERKSGHWIVRVRSPCVSCIRLWANGRECGLRAWAPWEWDVSVAVREMQGDRLVVRMEICGNLRNVFGPHHYDNDDKLNFLSEQAFFDKQRWTNRYVLQPLGLEAVELFVSGGRKVQLIQGGLY